MKIRSRNVALGIIKIWMNGRDKKTIICDHRGRKVRFVVRPDSLEWTMNHRAAKAHPFGSVGDQAIEDIASEIMVRESEKK